MFQSNMLVRDSFVEVSGSDGIQHFPISEVNETEATEFYTGLDIYNTRIVRGYGLQIAPTEWAYFKEEGDANIFLEKQFGTIHFPTMME
jgi:spore germination protein YaaH